MQSLILLRSLQLALLICALVPAFVLTLHTGARWIVALVFLAIVYTAGNLVGFWRRNKNGIPTALHVDATGLHVTVGPDRGNEIPWSEVVDIAVHRRLFGLWPIGDLRVRVASHGEYESVLQLHDINVLREADQFLRTHWKLHQTTTPRM